MQLYLPRSRPRWVVNKPGASVRYWWKADVGGHTGESYLRPVTATSPMSVGLGGDGDEIVAIDDVERAFRVKLDKAGAVQWHTAGDVFASLSTALPADTRDEAPWSRFTEVLADQTGGGAKSIQKDSPLLSQSRLWVHVANVSAAILIATAVVMLALMGWALL